MRKVPISFAEKVEARYTRGSRDQCWIWDGGVQQGRPSINLRHVVRYIFEQEFGPIPEGHTLWRIDHDEGCRPRQVYCRHLLCVNPYHLQLRPRSMPLYPRENSWAIDDTSRVAGYKKRRKHAHPRDSEGEPLAQRDAPDA